MPSLQSQHQDTGKYCTIGTHEFHQRCSLFWEQITSLSSRIILNFWGRVENVRHLKLLRLCSCNYHYKSWFAPPEHQLFSYFLIINSMARSAGMSIAEEASVSKAEFLRQVGNDKQYLQELCPCLCFWNTIWLCIKVCGIWNTIYAIFITWILRHGKEAQKKVESGGNSHVAFICFPWKCK